MSAMNARLLRLRLAQPYAFNAWWSWSLAALLVMLCLVAGGLRWHRSHQALQTETQTHSAAVSSVAGKLQGSPANTARSFVEDLPLRQDEQALLQAVRLLCTQNEVALQSLQLQPAPAQAHQLSRLNLVLKAQGRYASMKRLLAELSERYPAMTVPQLRLRAAPGAAPGLREMDATLAFWAQPPTPGDGRP